MIRLLLALTVAFAIFSIAVGGASAATASLSVSPPSHNVDQNQTFTISVRQNSDVVTTGAQTDITFDPSLLQIVDVQAGAAYQGASLLVGVFPQTKEDAIAAANISGTLTDAATFYIPGAGEAPVGDAEFLTVSMTSRSAGGTSNLTLSQAFVTEAGGSFPFEASVTGGQVTVSGPTAAPTPVTSPTPSPTATPVGQSPTPTPTSNIPTDSPTPIANFNAKLWLTPATLDVRPNTEFNLTLVQNAEGPSTGAQADIKFDPQVLQIVSITKGPAYSKGSLIYGGIVQLPATPITGAAAIAEANSTGILRNLAVFLVPPANVPAGQTDAAIIKMKSKDNGTSTKVELIEPEVLSTEGLSVPVGGTGGQVNVSSNAPVLNAAGLPRAGGPASEDGSLLWVLLLGGGLALLITGVTSLAVARRR